MKHPRRLASALIQPLESRLLFAAASLDRTFSGDGKAIVDVAQSNDRATAVAIDADGRTIIAGAADMPITTPSEPIRWLAALARLRPDGTPDPTFGPGGEDGDGKVSFEWVNDGGDGQRLRVQRPADLMLLDDGKMLLLVTAGPDNDIDTSQVAVLRLTPDGAPDPTFGGGDGVVATRFGQSVSDEFGGNTAVALAPAPGGRIVVVGHVFSRRFGGVGVARFHADGRPDTSFATDGSAVYEFDTTPEVEDASNASDVAVAPDGDIVIAGGYAQGFFDFAVLRLNPDGSVEARATELFRGSGTYENAQAEAVGLLPGGDIVLGGWGQRSDLTGDFALVRLNPDLTRDTSFGGGDGIATSRFGAVGASIQDLAVLPGDKVLAAGQAAGNFALARFNADGSPDTTFDADDASPDGRKTTHFGTASGARAVTVARNGRIVAAGVAGSDFGVARYVGEALEPQPGPGEEVTYQAENARLSGAVVSRSHAGYTGSGFVDYVNSSGDFTEWTVGARAAGTHRLTFRYANGGSSDRPLELKVNGQVVRSRLSFRGTGGWDKWQEVSVDVPLGAGANVVRLTAVGSSGPNVDKLTVRPSTQPTPETLTLQAEAGRLSGAVVSRNHGGYTGTGFVDFANASGDFIEWDVDVPAAGAYTFELRYANGSPSLRPLMLSVDGTFRAEFIFPPTGSWSNWSTARVTTQLAAGRNTVRVTDAGSSGPNVDRLTVRPAASQTLQAESARLSNAPFQDHAPGYTGSGYVSFFPSGSSATFTVNVPETRDYRLEFRYSIGNFSEGPLRLRVDGRTLYNVGFRPTGGWEQWKILATGVPLRLAAGTHEITLESTGSGGGVNLDAMTII